MTLQRGIDCSEWTREIPRHWWTDLKREHNVEIAIIQCWGGGPVPGGRNEFFAQQAEGALRAGMKLGTYCWPPSAAAPAIAYVKSVGFPLDFFALDVEAGAGVKALDVANVEHAGYEPWLYGNKYTLARVPLELRHLPIWLARYAYTMDRMWWPGAYWPYGGMEPLATFPFPGGWQFQGTTGYKDESMDLNLFVDFPQGDEGMASAEYEELKRDVKGLQELLAAVADTLNVRVEDIEEGTLEVPIWPVGPVTLREIRHRGYHGPQG